MLKSNSIILFMDILQILILVNRNIFVVIFLMSLTITCSLINGGHSFLRCYKAIKQNIVWCEVLWL